MAVKPHYWKLREGVREAGRLYFPLELWRPMSCSWLPFSAGNGHILQQITARFVWGHSYMTSTFTDKRVEEEIANFATISQIISKRGSIVPKESWLNVEVSYGSPFYGFRVDIRVPFLRGAQVRVGTWEMCLASNHSRFKWTGGNGSKKRAHESEGGEGGNIAA